MPKPSKPDTARLEGGYAYIAADYVRDPGTVHTIERALNDLDLLGHRSFTTWTDIGPVKVGVSYSREQGLGEGAVLRVPFKYIKPNDSAEWTTGASDFTVDFDASGTPTHIRLGDEAHERVALETYQSAYVRDGVAKARSAAMKMAEAKEQLPPTIGQGSVLTTGARHVARIARELVSGRGGR